MRWAWFFGLTLHHRNKAATLLTLESFHMTFTKSLTATAARVYVGTYAKYNDGSIAGKWLNLEDYADAEEFGEACKALHPTESDPEFMFQDWEGVPEGMIAESSINADFWDWVVLKDDDKKLLSVYREHCDRSGTLENARDAFMGVYESATDWAESYIDDCGMLEGMAENIKGYFNYESYARDAGLNGMTFADVGFDEVYVFNSI